MFTTWILKNCFLGIIFALSIEVIPSEIVLAFAGFLVARGDISFFMALLAAIIGGILSQLILYILGYFGGRSFLERYGKFLFIHKKHLVLAEKWFRNYGTGFVFGARFIPILRHAISVPAGIAKMPFFKFLFLTTAAVIPWSVFFIYLGMKIKSNWYEIEDIARPYLLFFCIFAGILLISYFLVKDFKKSKQGKY